MLDNESIKTAMTGFSFEASSQKYCCSACGKKFHRGLIYQIGEQLCEAEKAAELHVLTSHGDRLEYLIELGKGVHGLSEVQSKVLLGKYLGKDDETIAREIGNRSASTVRNHRFQLQKKRKEAQIFLAIMGLMESRDEAASPSFIEFHPDLPVADDRVLISREEAAELEAKYLDQKEEPSIIKFPRKEKAKLVVLRRVAQLFTPGKSYSPGEVDAILKPCMDDYATLRRYLIEYRFLKRTPGGGEYWRD
jgi:hypothetical protein